MEIGQKTAPMLAIEVRSAFCTGADLLHGWGCDGLLHGWPFARVHPAAFCTGGVRPC